MIKQLNSYVLQWQTAHKSNNFTNKAQNFTLYRMRLALLTIITYITVANGQERKVINAGYNYKGDKQKSKTDNMGGGPYQNPRKIAD